MSLFITPKTWAFQENVFAEQLNNLTAAIKRSANSIRDGQVDPAAALQGSKFANLSVTGAQINDGAVTQAKLAQDATLSIQSSVWSETVYTQGTLPLAIDGDVFQSEILASTVQTMRGGTRLVIATATGTRLDVADNPTVIFTLRRVFGGLPTFNYAIVDSRLAGGVGLGGRRPLSVTLVGIDFFTIGTPTFEFTYSALGDATSSDRLTINAVGMVVLEFS